MITQYKNIENINVLEGAITGERIDRLLVNQLIQTPNIIQFDAAISQGLEKHKIELHIYAGKTWLTGNHSVQPLSEIPEYTDNITGNVISLTYQPLAIDLYKVFKNLNIDEGNYNVVVNFFRNLIGDYQKQYIVVDDISPDRTEIRLRAIDSENQEFLQQLALYINNVNQTNITEPNITSGPGFGNQNNFIYKSYLLNFGRNQLVHYINSVVVGEYLYVKLYSPLPDNIEQNFKCWVVVERKMPYIDKVSIIAQGALRTFNRLSGPNWDANGDYNLSTDTGLKTWNDLLGSSIPTSQQIVDSYFSGSLHGLKLNIDYTDFNNFIFYSSATDRVKNYKYKLGLIEYYETQANLIGEYSGSTAVTNVNDITKLKTNLIGGFDNFENFLYYESSSALYSNEIPHESPNVVELTGSYITPSPKSNNNVPYSLYPITSSIFTNWYNELLGNAGTYDSFNLNLLSKSLPEFIRINEDNINAVTFVNMLGQHYDVFYMYINHMSKIQTREENPKLGMPNELLFSVAKQFGWDLVNGNQNKDLWDYVLGTDESGIPITGSNSVTGESLSAQDRSYTIWRRIVNNLPLLLKSKGTRRSIRALLSCYGIPQSIITIKEYGGPRTDRIPLYKTDTFNYALDLINNTTGGVKINYTQPIQTMELGFRTENIADNPNIPSTMNLFYIDGNSVTLDFISGNKGAIQINGTSSAAIELYDGDWLNAMVRVNGNLLEVVAKKQRCGKIVASVSSSATASLGTTGTIILGGLELGVSSRFSGQFRELRLWTGSLLDAPFENHTRAAGAYDGNVDAYDELVFRLPFSQKINHTLTSSLAGYEPNPSGISASFDISGTWTNDIPYDSYNDTYYYDGVSIATATYDDNKVRLEDNELIGNLDLKTRAERSQFDKAPIDSNKLGVYFSPQTMIDEDIIAQLGFTVLDDYIGDPGDLDKYSYPRLVQFANEYWKKYENANDFNAYIKMFTLYDLSFFKQVSQLIPARVNKLTGVLVQPNLLERSKDTILPNVSYTNDTYEALIDLDVESYTMAASYQDLLTTISNVISNPEAELFGEEYSGIVQVDSDNAIYNGYTYCYDQLFFSGSTITTGSSAYWLCEALLPVIIGSTLSTFSTNTSGNPSEIQDYLPTGLNNAYYNGSQLTSENFNVPTTATIDGGPVVEITEVNPNQIITQNPTSGTGNFQIN